MFTGKNTGSWVKEDAKLVESGFEYVTLHVCSYLFPLSKLYLMFYDISQLENELSIKSLV